MKKVVDETVVLNHSVINVVDVATWMLQPRDSCSRVRAFSGHVNIVASVIDVSC